MKFCQECGSPVESLGLARGHSGIWNYACTNPECDILWELHGCSISGRTHSIVKSNWKASAYKARKEQGEKELKKEWEIKRMKEKLNKLQLFIYELVEAALGKKKLKYRDIEKEVFKKYPNTYTKNEVKMAVKWLIDNGHCVYTYFGGSYIEIPHEEGAAKKI